MNRWIRTGALLVALATSACASIQDGSATPAPTSTEAPTPTASPEPTPVSTPDPADDFLAACAGAPQPTDEPIVIDLIAANTAFNMTRLEGPRHCEPFTITLTNKERIWEHNVTIALRDEGGTRIFVGPLVAAPSTARYNVPALPAGEYSFYCLPHPDLMRGTLVVVP